MTDESLRHSQCTGKAQHESYEAAMRQQEKGKRTSKGMSKRLKIFAYRCRWCSKYHVGHSVRKAKSKMKRKERKHHD